MALAKNLRVLITGSRDWTSQEQIEEAFRALMLNGDSIKVVIHGGARGADSIAGKVAEKWAIPTQVMEAQWNVYGKSAGAIRNEQMLALQPSIVLAFWDGQSRGTKHMIDLAQKQGYRVVVYLKPGRAQNG